jgi:hypothetical protein
MPAELQAIHRYVLETPVPENVSEEIGTVIENVWPELISKLPPKALWSPPHRERARARGRAPPRFPYEPRVIGGKLLMPARS